MRRSMQVGALVTIALLAGACGNTTGDANGTSSAAGSPSTTSAPPPPAIVSPALLDAGSYPTAPRPPLGTAGNSAAGAAADAQHMAGSVVGPWVVDDKLIEPYLNTYYVINDPGVLQQLGPEGIAAAAGRHGLVNGFASARQTADKAAMVNAVLRFPNPSAAAAASTEMADAVVKQPILGVTPTSVPIPGHPEAVAATYPFTPHGSNQTSAAVRSFTPHGPYVLMQFAQSIDGVDAATAMVAKAVDAQGPAIDEFKAADPGALADVQLDPSGLLAKTLPAPAANAAKNAVYTARGAMHFQSDPIASDELFSDTGVTDVAMARTNVYQAKDPQAALRVIDAFNREISADGTTPADPVRALPDSHCLAFPKGFYCVAPAGRFAIEARGEQLPDVQQQVAAQYVMLTSG